MLPAVKKISIYMQVILLFLGVASFGQEKMSPQELSRLCVEEKNLEACETIVNSLNFTLEVLKISDKEAYIKVKPFLLFYSKKACESGNARICYELASLLLNEAEKLKKQEHIKEAIELAEDALKLADIGCHDAIKEKTFMLKNCNLLIQYSLKYRKLGADI